MPIIKSAKKRMRTSQKAAIRNSKTKRQMKTAIKQYKDNISQSTQALAQSKIDKAAKKGVIHKNKASRLKSRLAKQARSSNINLTNKKVTKPKTTAKKATT